MVPLNSVQHQEKARASIQSPGNGRGARSAPTQLMLAVRALTLLSCARGLLEDGYSDVDILQWVLCPAEESLCKAKSSELAEDGKLMVKLLKCWCHVRKYLYLPVLGTGSKFWERQRFYRVQASSNRIWQYVSLLEDWGASLSSS
jgi:hypothetical protein